MKEDLFKSFFDLYYKKVYRSTYLAIGDENLAQDATQEAFFEAYKCLDKINDINKLQTWLKTVAYRNALKTAYKNRNVVLTNILEENKDEEMNLDEIIISKELKEEMATFLKELCVNHRQVIIFKYYYDMSYKEISQKLNIPIGTVKSRLYRAKKTLRNKIERTVK